MLGHADRIAVGDLGDGEFSIHRRLKIGVIKTDAGGDGLIVFDFLARAIQATRSCSGRARQFEIANLGVFQFAIEP